MNGKTMLYVSQFGVHYFAKTVKELRSQIEMGGSRVSKMFCDTKDGKTVHVGYVIGQHWLTCYIPFQATA